MNTVDLVKDAEQRNFLEFEEKAKELMQAKLDSDSRMNDMKKKMNLDNSDDS